MSNIGFYMRYLLVLVFGVLLTACNSEERFLDRNIDIDSSNKSIASVELMVGGQTKEAVLPVDVEVPVVVEVRYQDGSVVWAPFSDVDFTLDHSDLDVDTPLVVVENSMVKALAEHSEPVKLLASYQGHVTDPVNLHLEENAASLSSLQLTPPTQTLPNGFNSTLTLTAVYSDNTTVIISNSSATWSISSGEGVTVSNGEVTAVEPNKAAVVKVVYRGLEATATVHTSTSQLRELTLFDTTTNAPMSVTTLPVGMKQDISIVATFSDGSTSWLNNNNANIRYHTADSAVAAYSTGLNTLKAIDAKAPGMTSLWVEYTDPTTSLVYNSNVGTVVVTDAAVRSLAIEPSFNVGTGLLADTMYSLKAKATLTDNSVVDITSLSTWSSNDKDVATFSGMISGLFNAREAGSATLTATYRGYTDTLDINVVATKLVSLSVSSSTDTIHIGEELQYKVEGHYDNGTTIDLTSQVSWSSRAVSVATISQGGKATAVAVGNTQIYATKSGVDGYTTINVMADKLVKSVSIDPLQASSLAKGQSTALSATITYQDDSTNSNAAGKVRWVVADYDIGLVHNGKWYAQKAGTTKIHAEYGGVNSSEASLTVTTASITDLELAPSNSIELAKGRTFPVTLTAHYTDSSTQVQTQSASWSSSKSSVASVDNGVITAVNNGTATITATLSGKSVSVGVEVKDAQVNALLLNGDAAITLNQGETLVLPTQWIHSDGSVSDVELTDTRLSYHTDNASVVSFDTTTKNQLIARAEGLTQVWVKHTNSSTSEVIQSQKVTVLVQSKKVSYLSFTQSQSGLPKGESTDFKVQAHFTDNSSLDVTSSASWSSSDIDVLTVSRGVVTASSSVDLSVKDTAQVTASYDGQSVSKLVTLNAASLSYITVSPTAMTIQQNLTRALSVTAHYSNGSSSVLSSSVLWQSSAESVATVSSDGVVTGVKSGEALIKATVNGHTVSSKVFVIASSVERIEIVLANDTFKVGESQTILVNAYYQGASSVAVDVTNQTAWQATSGHARVLGSNIIGMSLGTDTMRASFGGKSVTQDIKVQDVVYTHLRLSILQTSLVEGHSTQVELLGIGRDGSLTVLNDKTGITWSIEDDTVIKVESDNRTLKGLTMGMSTLSAKFESLTSNSLTIEIVEKDKILEAYVLSSRDTDGVKYFAKGDKKQVTVTYGGVKVPLDEVKLTLMSSSNITLDSSTGTIEFGGQGCSSQDLVMRDTQCIPSEHAILLVETKGATAFVSLPYVGYVIEKTEVHQYFPEPAAGATGLDLLNTTRPEVPPTWARRLYATITYSDGSRDTRVTRYHDNQKNGLGIFKIKGASSNKGTALLLGNSMYGVIAPNDDSWHVSSGMNQVREIWYRQQKISQTSTSWPTDPSGLFIANDMTVPNATSSPGTAVGDKYYVSASPWPYVLPSNSPIYDLLFPSANSDFFYSIDENPIELTVVSGNSYVNATWGVLAPDNFISHGPITAGDVKSVISDPMWSSYTGRTTASLHGVEMGYFSYWAEGMGMQLPSGQIGVCGHLYPESNSNVNGWFSYRTGLLSVTSVPQNSIKYDPILKPENQEELLGWLYSASARLLGVDFTETFRDRPMVGYMNATWDYNFTAAPTQNDRFLLQCGGCKYGGDTYIRHEPVWNNEFLMLQCSTP